MAWTNNQLGPIGLDLGGHTIRLIQLSSTTDRLSVAVAAGTPVSPGQVDSADRIRANADVIKKLIHENGFSGRKVVTAIPLSATRVKSFRLPCMPAEELDGAVRFEALERFQSLDEEPEIRYYNAGRVEGGQGNQYELIVTAVRGDVIRDHLEALRDIGLLSQAVDFAPAASFRPFERFLKREEDADEVNAFLDIGYEGTRLVIASGSEVAFVRVYDIGALAFEAAVAKALSVEPARASELYEAFARGTAQDGQAPEDEMQPAILDAVKPVIEHLSKELGLCLRYFSVTFRGLHSNSITCVGGASRNHVLLERLGEVVGIPARAGHPLRHIATDRVFTGSDRRSGQPEWATAVGLAMKGLRIEEHPRKPLGKAVVA